MMRKINESSTGVPFGPYRFSRYLNFDGPSEEKFSQIYRPRTLLELDETAKTYKANKQKDLLKSIGSTALDMAPGVLSLVSQGLINARYENTAQDLLAGAGTNQQLRNGVNTTIQNDIDSRQIMSEENASATQNTFGMAMTGLKTGAMFGLGGAAVGAGVGAIVGLVTGNAKKKDALKAIRQANISKEYTNNLAGWMADNTAIQNLYNKEYGWSNNQVLHAKKGIDDMRYEVNAMLAPGETVADAKGNIKGVVPGINPNRDSYPANLKNGDIVFSNEEGYAQQTYPLYVLQQQITNKITALSNNIQKNKGKNTEIAKNAAKAEMNKLLQAYTDSLQQVLALRNYQHADRVAGNLPPEDTPDNLTYAAGGLDGNLLSGILGGMVGLGLVLSAKKQKVHKPNTYVKNPYAPQAIAELDALRVNPNPVINQIVRDEAKANYTINNSGALSAALKYIGRVANAYNTQKAKATALVDIFDKNNQYRADRAKVKANIGAQESQNAIRAGQYDDESYAKGHAFKSQGQQGGIYNMLNALQTYIANKEKYDMYKNMYALFRDDLKIKREAIKKGVSTK